MRLPFFIICRFCCPFAVLPFCVTSTFSVEFPFRFMFCLVCCPCVPGPPAGPETNHMCSCERGCVPTSSWVETATGERTRLSSPWPDRIDIPKYSINRRMRVDRSCKCTWANERTDSSDWTERTHIIQTLYGRQKCWNIIISISSIFWYENECPQGLLTPNFTLSEELLEIHPSASSL